jgi:dienelactone hydrolase
MAGPIGIAGTAPPIDGMRVTGMMPRAGAGGMDVVMPPRAGTGADGMTTLGPTAGMRAGASGTAGTGDTSVMGGRNAGIPNNGDAFAVRGDDPTEESANGRNKGPYTVASYTSGYASGTFEDATIWYPTDAEPPYGCIAVVPGYVSPQASIRNWGPFLASHGIVAITIGVPGGDQPAVRATKLMSAVDSCTGENDRSGSPLLGKVSKDHVGVSGWSMGGGGALIAASEHPELKGAVSFAAWGPIGGAMNKVPTLMFEATADSLAAGMSDGYYAQVPDSVPKMLFEVQGSSHNVANDPASHDGIIGLYGLSWWKVFLEGDQRYVKFLTAPKPSITTSKFDHNLD